MLKIIEKIKRKHCNHKERAYNFEPITENTYYEYICCDKCGSKRKDLVSLGHRVKGEWNVKN
jgi:hypothetical protein